MPNTHFLKSSLITLDKITDKTYNKDISPTAKAIWHKHLRAENPLWKFVTAKPFLVNEDGESAHVIAMVDSRLPDIGLVGFFACTNKAIGIKALKLANNWLKQEHGIKTAYGPINGTITRDYRLNLSHDFLLIHLGISIHLKKLASKYSIITFQASLSTTNCLLDS
jgi:hypothetical protein